MAKQTGWYYASTDAAMTAHHFQAPLARGELRLPACGDEKARTLGRDLRHESMRSVRCTDCEALLEPDSEALVEAGLAEATEEAMADPANQEGLAWQEVRVEVVTGEPAEENGLE